MGLALYENNGLCRNYESVLLGVLNMMNGGNHRSGRARSRHRKVCYQMSRPTTVGMRARAQLPCTKAILPD